MGDDTWMSLFPNDFQTAYPFPSFDVWDLHTVDDGVVQHLFPKLSQSAQDRDWDILVGHFLGVDHAGHRYGPEHIAMARKLEQVNGWLERVFDMVDEHTLVIVMGDHGMDPKGDHGGDTRLEMDTVTFLYSKSPILSPTTSAAWDHVLQKLNSTLPHSHSFVYHDGFRSIPQIDFVATFAQLMGIPIPFGNLGVAIPELFLGGETGGSTTNDHPMADLITSARLNARQMHNYLLRYCETSSDLSIGDLSSLFDKAEASHLAFTTSSNGIDHNDTIWNRATDVYVDYVVFMRTALLSAREIWAKFNDPLILLGLVVLGIASISLLLRPPTPLFSPQQQQQQQVYHLFSITMGLVLGAVTWTALALLHGSSSPHFKISPFQWALSVFSVTCLFMGTVYAPRTPSNRLDVKSKSSLSSSSWFIIRRPHQTEVLALVLALLHILVPAASSYTYWEEWVTHFLLQTFGLFELITGLLQRRANIAWAAFAFMLLNRISNMSTICREQGPECVPTFNASSTMSVAALWTIPVYIFVQLVAWVATRVFIIKVAGGSVGRFVNTIMPLGLIIACAYWSLDTLEGNGILVGEMLFLTEVKLWIAQGGMSTWTLISLYTWIASPLSPTVGGENKDLEGDALLAEVESSATATSSYPSTRLRSRSKQHRQSGGRGQHKNPLACSLFDLLLVVYLFVLYSQKPMGGIMLGLALLKMMCLVYVWSCRGSITTAINKNNARANITQSPDYMVRYLPAIVLHLLAVKIFFSTGHQTTFSTIQWEVGFIGLKKVNWFLSPMFVFLNTFGGFILCSLCLVVCCVWNSEDNSTKQRTASRPSSLSSKTEAAAAFKPIEWIVDVLQKYLAVIFVAVGVNAALAAHFKRHLLVWAIFAPRFIFSTIWGATSIIFTLLGLYAYKYVGGRLADNASVLKKNK